MKTRYYFPLILFMLTALSACKKKDIEYTSYEPSKIVSKYLVRTIHTLNGVTDFTDYTYDDRKRLSTVKNGANLLITYTYNGSNLFSIESRLVDGANIVRNVYQYSYSSGILAGTTRKIYVNDVLTKEYTFTHTLTRGEVMQTVVEPGATTMQYTFAGGNITSFNNGTGVANYTHDGQNSIYANALAAYPYPGDIADRYSKNSLIKTVAPTGGVTNYTYTYDVDGYPIAMLTGQDRYTYSYVTIN